MHEMGVILNHLVSNVCRELWEQCGGEGAIASHCFPNVDRDYWGNSGLGMGMGRGVRTRNGCHIISQFPQCVLRTLGEQCRGEDSIASHCSPNVDRDDWGNSRWGGGHVG